MMRKALRGVAFCLPIALALGGCAGSLWDDSRAIRLPGNYRAQLSKDPALVRRILAIDPDDVSPADVKVLAQGPTPWFLPVAPAFPGAPFLKNFLNFLADMGYPRERIGDPRDRDYNISYLASSETIAGLIAWLYERDGLSPMIMGWSAGGFITVSILHDLDRPGKYAEVRVVNGLTGEVEDRSWIRDPYSGKKRPIRGVRVSFAAILASGGLGRLTQFMRWGDRPPLRAVPDSVRELLAFHAPFDPLGTDFLNAGGKGYAKANEFVPMGSARARTIIADSSYGHVNVIFCNLLTKNAEGRKWVETYRPRAGYGVEDLRESGKFTLLEGKRNLWCGEFWYRMKRNWAIEAQRLARAAVAARDGGNRLALRRGR